VKLLSSIREPSGLLKLAQNSECRSKKVRWMSLQGFSSKNLSIDFDLKDAIAIDLKRSLLRLVWKQPQVFINCHFEVTLYYFISNICQINYLAYLAVVFNVAKSS